MPTVYPRSSTVVYLPPISVPINLTVPTISGVAAVNQTLAATPGTFSGGFLTLTYQWKADGVAIVGATGLTYLLTATETGKVITITETATNGAGAASATSAPTGAVAGGTVGQPIGFLLLLTYAA